MSITKILDKNVTSTSLHQILLLYQKRIHSVGIEMLNSLPKCIKNFNDNPKQFKSAPKTYYICAYSYSIEEYVNVNREC